jgi:hypothetical protein
MSMTDANRRRHARVNLAGPIVASLVAGHEGRVLDVSGGGLRLEHHGIIRPGESCLLRFGLNDELFTFSGRVAWSRAIGRGGARNTRLVFHSGIVWERIPGAARPLLSQLLEQ